MELALVGNKPDQLKSVKFRRGAKASNSGVEEMIVMQTSPDIHGIRIYHLCPGFFRALVSSGFWNRSPIACFITWP